MAVNSVNPASVACSFTSAPAKVSREEKIREQINNFMNEKNVTKDEYVNLCNKKKKNATIFAVGSAAVGLFTRSFFWAVPAIFALFALKSNNDHIKVAKDM